MPNSSLQSMFHWPILFTHMLSQAQEEIIQKNLHSTLYIPTVITQKEYIETYNCVYSYCTGHSNNYVIKGEAIYDLLKTRLEEFANNLEFQGSICDTAKQIQNLNLTIDLLEKLFSYLERFYIKTSILNYKDVKKLRDLFFYKIYYQFIFKIEENLVNIIFLEIETLRKMYKQNFSELTTVIDFYFTCLTINGLVTNMIGFSRRYVEEFKQSFNFNVEIGKFLKKIYLEMFFITTVINDKDMAKEVIQTIIFRKDEILDYVFKKIDNFEKFKHIYVIITMMPENCKAMFKKRYEDFVVHLLEKSITFDDFFTNYCRLGQQVTLNKLSGYDELINECFKCTFLERPVHKQTQIHREMMEYFHGCLMHAYYIRDVLGRCSDSRKLSVQCVSTGSEAETVKHGEDSFINSERFFDLFSLICDDDLIDLYTQSTQERLLKGMDPAREEAYTNIILERVGWGSASILKNSVTNFKTKQNYLFDISVNNVFSVSCVRITKSFWGIEKDEPNLHPSLESIKKEISASIERPARYILEFNFAVSPIIFSFNNTRYKMSSSAVSLLLYIQESTGIDINTLQSLANDKFFEKNLEMLLKNGFISIQTDSDNTQKIFALDKYSEEAVVDLFELPVKKVVAAEPVVLDTQSFQILEAKICKIMKKSKELMPCVLREQLGSEEVEFENAISNLISKGYLSVSGSYLVYIP